MNDRLRAWVSSYRTRLALSIVGVAALVMGVWTWSLYGPLTASVVGQQRAHLQVSAELVARALGRSEGALAPEVRSLASGTDLRVTVVASDGTVLADSQEDAAKMSNHATRPEIREALSGRVGFDTRVSSTQGIPQMYVAVPATIRGDSVAVRASEPQRRVDALVASVRRSGILALAASLLLAAAVTWRLSKQAAAPVTRLASAARSMAGGDLHTPVEAEKGELGEVSAALVMLRDQIRDRMAQLHDEQAVLRTTLDGLPDAVFLIDGDVIEYANGPASRAFGLPASGWEGAVLDSPPLPAPIVAAIAEGRRASSPASVELGPDPLMRYHRVTTMPLAGTGGSDRTLAVVSDVTERRRVDAMRRDFVSNASHELKTPVAAIKLLADSAAMAASDGDVETALGFVSKVKDEADRLRRLVTDLLDLSRLERPIAPGSVTDLREAMDLAVTAHGAAASAAGIELEVETAGLEGEDVYASADPTDVAIALDNVLANAIAYTVSGSVTVRLEADGTSVTVTVADTGPGIAAEHLPRVFERFYRVDSARTRDAGGTGLGLSLVRNAVERSGGSVGIESVLGEGTSVALTLPRAR